MRFVLFCKRCGARCFADHATEITLARLAPAARMPALVRLTKPLTCIACSRSWDVWECTQRRTGP